MRDYKALLEAGNRAQLEKLKENEHKDGFNQIDLEYAVSRIREETEELEVELIFRDNDKNIRREAADIANFAHMIIFGCDRKLKEGK
jgi:uncharacterized protein YjaG (DUF416 family)